jgi:RNA 3'-terminal phosphate cyclase-like protein
MATDIVRLTSAEHFRQRVVLSILSARVLRIDGIRSNEERPGLTNYEANFLRLVSKLTNGTSVEINDTGTKLRIVPGIVCGGRNLIHDCRLERPVGYFVEGILPLLPFAKEPTTITFKGITNDSHHIGIDSMRLTTLRILKPFGIEGPMLDLQIKKRGMAPKGGGEVVLRCPIVRKLKPVQITDVGFVKRIRGVAYAARISPQMANRMVSSARGVFNKLLADVYINTDHARGHECGESPGYGIALIAETHTGALYSAECNSKDASLRPEEIGERAAHRLFDQIKQGGCLDATHQGLAFTLMALCPEDVSRIRIGKLSKFGIDTLRALDQFLKVRFRLKPDKKTGTIMCSCVGSNYTNVAKKVT